MTPLNNSNITDIKPAKVIPDNKSKDTFAGKRFAHLKDSKSLFTSIFDQLSLMLHIRQSPTKQFAAQLNSQVTKKEDVNKVNQESFLQIAKNSRKPPQDPLILKTGTETFNHTHDFSISDDMIWCRLRNQIGTEWKPIFFDGYSSDEIPKEIDCDGANLVVLDQKHNVHYKKIIKEYRSTEIEKSKNAEHRIIDAGVDLKQDYYIAIDKTEKNNWKEKWFSLPFINPIVNFFTGKRLHIPDDAKAWAISHRGRYNDYLEDELMQHHDVGTGVTTLYALDKQGKEIFKYDPWSPKTARMNIFLPESETRSFRGENMSASASTLMVLGYETNRNNPNSEELAIYTQLADIDSKGWSPGLKYDYFKGDSKTIVIPLPPWKKHELTVDGKPLEGQASITKKITIMQTGAGNNARLLVVEGKDKEGKIGYYWKKITDETWHFKPNTEKNNIRPSPSDFLQPSVNISRPFETTVHSYASTNLTFERGKDSKADSITASLKNFGRRSDESTIDFKVGSEFFSLKLYRKKSLKNFMGFEGEKYDLVIPKELHLDPSIKKYFGKQKVFHVEVQENSQGVSISHSELFAANTFTLNFEKS